MKKKKNVNSISRVNVEINYEKLADAIVKALKESKKREKSTINSEQVYSGHSME